MTPAPALRAAVLRWIAADPDAVTREELQRVLEGAMTGAAGAADELADRMAGPLRFGTAGLRGPVRAGPNGMNVAVVLRATAGLAAWLVQRGHGGRPVVVGHDARYGSAAFAEATGRVLAAAGFGVCALGCGPTPLLAFAVRRLGAAAGVQITASHNPATDNGYKVYLDDGAQLVAPTDTEIEAEIAAVPAAVSVPTAGADAADGPGPDNLRPDVTAPDVTNAYLDRVAGLPRGTAREVRVALTPLHGVGGEAAVSALRRAGFTDVHVVAAQAAPDPRFPTVAFPNPEEPGVTDAVLALAAEVDADLAVALDPDADRCAVGIPDRDGSWRMLTGDETGVLLGDHLLRAGGFTDPLVATTVVSSEMMRAVAEGYHARFVETLTGFKWIVRGGPGLVFGYEEALGYCVDPDAVRDKDGIAAAVLAADLTAGLRAAGSGIPDRLDELARSHGVHLTTGFWVPLRSADRDTALARLRATPPAGWHLGSPAADVAVLRRGGDRLVVRPSGTEPKLKVYLQVIEPVPAGADLGAARARAAARLAALRVEVAPLLRAGDD